jgi:hypothetical protein
VYPSAVDNLSIVNNTFAFPNPWRTGHIIVAAPVTNSRIENNIFYQPNTVAINFYTSAGHSNLTIGNNMISSGATADAAPSAVILSGNSENTDPLLADPAGLDFRLANGSPAINAGAALSLVSNDSDGVSRPQGSGHDMGAYEALAEGYLPPPAISPGGAVRAGSAVEIYGTDLAINSCSAATMPGRKQLPCSPTRVQVNGRDVPLLFVSPLQVNAQLPSDLYGSVTLVVTRGHDQSNAVNLR